MADQINFFSFQDTKKVYLDEPTDQWVEIKKLAEGDRVKYERETQTEYIMNKNRDEIKTRFDTGTTRKALIESSVVGWRLLDNDVEVPFKKHEFERLLSKANPEVIDKLYLEIVKFNPWLNPMPKTTEEIDNMIDELKAERERVVVETEKKSD